MIRMSICLFLVLAAFACQQSVNTNRTLEAGVGPGQTKAKGAEMPATPGSIFQTRDGGQTWEDISIGLPEDTWVGNLTVTDKELIVNTDKGLYRSSQACYGPASWSADWLLPDNVRGIFAGRQGAYMNTPEGVFENISGTGIWSLKFDGLKSQSLYSLLETDKAMLAGADDGVFKSDDGGLNWKQVYSGGVVFRVVETGGVLYAGTHRNGLLRSEDGGENWQKTTCEGNTVVGLYPVNGGIMAVANTRSSERDRGDAERLYFSADQGLTWQRIGENLPVNQFIFDVAQAGPYLFCSVETGVFRSMDQGKTWELVRSSYGKGRFELSVSGNILLVLMSPGGC